MKFSRVPTNLMQAMQINSGILVDSFTPSTLTIGNILAATGGGVTWDPKPNFKDFGEGIDNLPPNTWQMKRLTHYEPHLTGTFKSFTADDVRRLQPGSAIAANHIVPGSDLTADDFDDVWLLGDYSDKNSGDTAGYVAIHLKNAMNVLGFRIKTNDKDKADIAFDFQGHYDLNDIDDVPFDFYVQQGSGTLAALTVTSTAGTAVGDSNIAVSGYSLGSGESYVYATAPSAAPAVTYGQKVKNWAALTNNADITPAAGHTKITVAVKNADNEAIASGTATLVVKTT